jgi:hypothetical protein
MPHKKNKVEGRWTACCYRAGSHLARPNFPAMFRRDGDYVDKILRGAKPADLPVEQPQSPQRRGNVVSCMACSITCQLTESA